MAGSAHAGSLFYILSLIAQLPSHFMSFSPLLIELQVDSIYDPITSSLPTVSTMDYGPLNEILMFEACETQKCVNVTITDDGVDELDETFTYHLRRTTSLDPRIILDPVNGRIVVVDNDGEIHIQ